ncbi:Ionotropic glutamate receptor [Sesbania bispinosa]|nr:Ionotropic glutamate receptor [Sesbania bispinosa]
MGKWFWCHFLIKILVVLLHIQSGSGLNATSMGVIKLRVGVPKKDGFSQFVNVAWDSRENKYNITGYCMEVFYAVINHLPFNVSLQIEPYVNESGHSAGTYDSLLQHLPTKYDVVVGDISIVANRSQYVDFTLPYSESGVRMLVPVQHGRHQTMWIFVKPFSWDLWLCIVIISMFIGLVILIMERNAHTLPNHHNEASPNRNHLSAITILWASSRQELLEICVDGLASVVDLLVHQLKFNTSKLKGYNNISEYHHALSIGSEVAAIFDEVPYLKAFPLNSNLTAHFSRAILNVTESDLMNEIEENYFGKYYELEEKSTQTCPPSLTFYSFAGLFMIMGIATLLALVVSETVIWQTPILMAKAYSQKYLFRTSFVHPRSNDSTHGEGGIEMEDV